MPERTLLPAISAGRFGARFAVPALVFLLFVLAACSKSDKAEQSATEPVPAPQSPSEPPTPASPPPPPVAAVPVNRPMPPEITAFVARKEKQARDFAARLELDVGREVWDYFDAARRGSSDEVFALWAQFTQRGIKNKDGEEMPVSHTPIRQVMLDVQLAFEAFNEGEPQYLFAYGRDIIQSIPPGSIYFGGTDPGRGLVTALCTSHEKGEPFFTLTQNALADGTYLRYLQLMYGERMSILASEDSQTAFQDYLTDAQRRLKHDQDFPSEPRQLRPGEDVRVIDNRVQVSGQVAVMSINGLLARMIFDRNSDREFYIEESFPLEWMYPHLEPHGLILRLHREPLVSITDESIDRSNAYWDERLRVMIGDWLRPETPVKEVAVIAEKVFADRDFTGFRGDTNFVSNDYVNKAFSKLRSAQGGIYAWRAQQTKDAREAGRMRRAADFAFRQSFALCPRSPEAVFRYVNLLMQEGRIDDALLVAQAAQQLETEGQSVENLIRELERMQRSRQPGL